MDECNIQIQSRNGNALPIEHVSGVHATSGRCFSSTPKCNHNAVRHNAFHYLQPWDACATTLVDVLMQDNGSTCRKNGLVAVFQARDGFAIEERLSFKVRLKDYRSTLIR